MTWAARARGSIDRLAGHFAAGDTVTVRRHHTLKNRTTGGLLTALVVNGVTASGATSVSLDSPNLTGTIQEGITFTLAGESGTPTHTVAADATAASGAVTVTFTPALASEVADDTACTVTAQKVDYTFRKFRRAFMERDLSEQIEATDRKIILSALGAAITPRKTDQIIEDGSPLNVQDLRPVKPGDTAAGYVVTVRS